jgi:cytochrome P450
MHGSIDLVQKSDQKAARKRAYSIPLEQFDPGDPELFRSDTFWPYFDRLRKEDPIHYCKDSVFGPYWSVTKYNDIMDIETNHSVFSSAAALGGITIRDVAPDLRRESFIAMDQPRHGAQRKTVAPMFTPTHLDQLAINIRQRSAECLDNLPKNDVFDWVDRVSIELTTQMLAVLFDFPWEDRRKLTRWSDVATTIPGPDGVVATEDARQAELLECATYFGKLWNEPAKERSIVDDGSQRSHARHGPEEFPRQPDPADRRRQRYHPQHAVGQRLCVEQESGSVPQAARESGADRQFRAGGDPLADATGAYAPDRAPGLRVPRQADQER